jgi:hypothetical protein
MSQQTLEERVRALEEKFDQLARQLRPDGESGRDDWKSTVGMFANDPIMKEILDEARKIRERDREQTRDQN